ncbi:hypothetical protein EDD18DRAFT_692883 [Armillaria luteobubalina]|uniref:Secreted protein n=1 Tax=Armillaria luteobubalina TaxID=153913 RepID=A0AA39TWN1_9AGAR|nr:hypothetical protein EDD18DRAFT_692883 [Armillaria luteobubalina]
MFVELIFLPVSFLIVQLLSYLNSLDLPCPPRSTIMRKPHWQRLSLAIYLSTASFSNVRFESIIAPSGIVDESDLSETFS